MTSTQSTKQHRRWRFRGIVADAQLLGVTYPHLWKVLAGKFKSPRLLHRYEALKAAQRTGTVSASAGESAGHFLNSKNPTSRPTVYPVSEMSQSFARALASLGRDEIIVAFYWADNPKLMGQLYCQDQLSAAMDAARAGSYDLTLCGVGYLWHCFRASSGVPKAVRVLLDQIAALALLDRTIVFVKEDAKLVVIYPNQEDWQGFREIDL